MTHGGGESSPFGLSLGGGMRINSSLSCGRSNNCAQALQKARRNKNPWTDASSH